VTIGSATANLLLSDSNTKILQNPRIRATDAQKATMKIGSRIPIATGSYSTGTSTSSVSSLVNTQFQYIDVGVNIEMTPTIHYDGDVTLKMKIEVSSENGSVTISSVTEPIIDQKVVDQVIRLHEGEASILGGIQDKEEDMSWTGIPGLSSIPFFKYLFGSKDRKITDDELVFLVVPHIVRTQSLDRVNLRTIDTGVGTSIDIRHVPSEKVNSSPGLGPGSNPGLNPAPVAAPALGPSAGARPTVGVVPGQSAMAAAPAALAQLSASADANGDTASAAVAGHTPSPASAASPAAPESTNFALTPLSSQVASGTTFPISVRLSGGKDIASVPLQIQYDPAQLSLVNVNAGDYLSRDGQPAALVHRDEGAGSVNIVASRPPGAAGVSGEGVVCVLTFQAKSAGESLITINHPAVVTSAQRQLPARGASARVVVQ
jgi:general secretion pathway protein D